MLTQIQVPSYLTMLMLQRVTFDSMPLILRSNPVCRLQSLDVQNPVSVPLFIL